MKNLKIMIENPSDGSVTAFLLAHLLPVYTKEQLIALFKGELDGEFWCWLADEEGNAKNNWLVWINKVYIEGV